MNGARAGRPSQAAHGSTVGVPPRRDMGIYSRKTRRETAHVPTAQAYYSFEDYLAAERESTDAKHEYVAGQVFAMAGASFNHNLITANLAG